MSQQKLEQRLVRYGDLQPCRTAFIDAHTPGSDQKENFTIIGGGVSESPDQHVHISETPGFNIGAAGQPPKCKNSMHTHVTAEVFYIHKGRWKFFWGEHGTDGEFIAEEGDLFNIPTGIFRGFENVGDKYGIIFAVLGGDDSGGGVVWAPHVIEAAKEHGLILAETGRLYDTKKGEQLPQGIKPMPLLTAEELKQFPVVDESEVISNYVARYWDMKAITRSKRGCVLGKEGYLKDRPGFEVDFLQRNQSDCGKAYRTECHEILMVHQGSWAVTVDGERILVSPGDVFAIPPNTNRTIEPTMTGETAAFLVRNTDDSAGLTHVGE